MAFSYRRILSFIAIVLCILIPFSYWEHKHRMHATPETALNSDVHIDTGRIVENIPFARGVVVIVRGHADTFDAYYLKPDFWGWKIDGQSEASLNLSTQNYNVDFEPFSADGKTFVWGTLMVPIKEIIHHHKGKTYTWRSPKAGHSLIWYIILPFTQTLFHHSEWSMVLDNGKTAPLFK
jgi:hypothetical protein